jgi:hypothetical protein
MKVINITEFDDKTDAAFVPADDFSPGYSCVCDVWLRSALKTLFAVLRSVHSLSRRCTSNLNLWRASSQPESASMPAPQTVLTLIENCGRNLDAYRGGK